MPHTAESKRRINPADFAPVHCPVCKKLLARARVGSAVEVKCKKCGKQRVVEISAQAEPIRVQ